MGQQIYATFDSVTIGSHLALSNGNLQLATQISSDNLRLARSTIVAGQASNVEFLIYSPDGSNPALNVQAMMIGICTSAASIANYLGADANGWGYCPGTGELRNNGAVVATFPTATYKDTITLAIDPKNLTLTIHKNGVPFPAYTLPANMKFYFAATVSGVPTGMNILINTGQTPFTYPIATLTGWWTARVTPNPVYIATEPFISLPTDKLAHQKFYGDLDVNGVTISRAVAPWMWGASKPSGMSNGASISLDLLDPYRIYEAFLTIDMRDLPVTLSRQDQNGSLNSAEAVYQAIIDKIEQTGDQTKRASLKDKLAQLQSQLNRPIFPPTVDPAVAGRTRPMALGVCRNYDPDLYDGTNFLYACSDAALTAFGLVRIQGVPQVYGGSYTVTLDAAGIDLVTTPAGKITVESTSYAGAFNATATDMLGGAGLIENLAINSQPALPQVQCYPRWAANTNYIQNTFVFNSGNIYLCVIAGLSAGSVGPTGTGAAGIVDNTVTWALCGCSRRAVWHIMACW
jgi:hypothetical protein